MKKNNSTNTLQKINKLKRVFVLFTFLIVLAIGCDSKKEVTYPENLSEIHENLLNFYLENPINNDKVALLLNGLDENGTWPAIDYTNKVRGNWPVKNHLGNVQMLAKAYKNENSTYFHNEELSEKIQLSLNYWLNNDFLSTNWWDQHIGVPELLLPTLFLIENELSKEQYDKALVLLNRAHIKMTGQNKVWLSANVMLRSLLKRNADSVAIASKAIQEELKIANGVGIKSDWSYHEHGAQLQFGNYGLSYLEDMIKWYTILDKTPYEFSSNKIETLRKFILNGQQWVIWKGKMDVSASGRQLFKNEQANKYARLKVCIQKMEALDKEHASAYKNAMNSEILSGNKHFWKSDFHVHRNSDFYFSVKMSSKRVIGTESVNQENIQGYYMGDGVSMLYTSGNEYTNIFPFWDWKKLPGTTIIQDDTELPIIKAWDFKTNSVFVGGVSNGNDGISVLDYNRDGLRTKKSWFMFGDKIVCLGSGINAITNFPVTTAINQVFLKNDLVISKDNIISGQKGNKQSLEPDWILHDGTGYLFPAKSTVTLETKFKEGSWNRVVKRYRPVILTGSTLKMWIDHGENPKNQSYEYILIPNANQEKMTALKGNQPFDIVNNVNLQSVISNDGLLGGIVFYKAGKSNLFGGVSVNKPCVVLLKKDDNNLEVSVSDPTHNLKKLQISIKGKYTGKTSAVQNNKTVLNVSLPEGLNAGKTVTFKLSNK